MKAEPVEKVIIDPRYAQLVAQSAIKDVFDAMVELITNSDDSYHRQYVKGYISEDGGPITIEIDRRNKQFSLVAVKDRAEGMTRSDMRDKIQKMGRKTSLETDRGFMGRGAKDCATLGKAIFESIKDNTYFKSEITSNLDFIPYKPQKATEELRERLGIRRANGTVVTLQVARPNRIPRFGTILRDLPYHMALRDILSENGPTKVKLQEGFDSQPLVYHQPKGKLVVEQTFEIPGYPGVHGKLNIWRSTESLNGSGERFRRYGIIIKGKRAIHESSLLYDEFEKDPLAQKYFGRLDCPYIDDLCEEYDKYRESGKPLPDRNFFLIIDPNRQKGLRRDHPFTKALFQTPSEQLRTLLSKDREEESKKRVQIANKETTGRLDRLAKEASKFIKERLEELQEISIDEFVDQQAFVKEGILIYPTYFKIAIAEQRIITVYVRASLIQAEKSILIRTQSDAVSILDPIVQLKPHKTRPDMFFGYFRLRGEKVIDKTLIIEAVLSENKSSAAVVQVVESRVEEHSFIEPLEFEYKTYHVKEGKTRILRLFARYPEVLSHETNVNILSSDNEGVPIRGKCILTPVPGSNYAVGEVTVQGRRLNSKAHICADISGFSASSIVTVVQRNEDYGIPFKFLLRDDNFGDFRATWADHEGNPNLLLISTRHKSLNRYLGPPPEYAGQDTMHFRLLLAEIITESVCRKSLVLEAKERNWEYHWADEKEDYIIADSVLSALHKRMRDFSVIAHSEMLDNKELTTTNQTSNPLL